MVDNPYKYPYVPVGGIIEWDGTGLIDAPDLTTPEKVAAVYGYGTWERYATDRVTVGAGRDYAAGSVGGEAKHALTVAELPKNIGKFDALSWASNNDLTGGLLLLTKSIKIKQCLAAQMLVTRFLHYPAAVLPTTICRHTSPTTNTAVLHERRTT
ncbi:hypothetical protein [Gemmiger sp.]|uniref:phage baseplate protein n=1 Tax=Gemmiger sp. TaxID=2049027 RepID=UPI00307F9DD1